MQRGEVWRVRLPPASGHTQSGDRPALVVQDDSFTSVLPTILVVPFTGNVAAVVSQAPREWTRTGQMV